MSQTSSSKRQLRSHVTKTYKNNDELDSTIAQDSYAVKPTKAQPYDIENSKTKKLKTIQKNKDITSTSLPNTTIYMEDVIDTHDNSIINNSTTENSQARLSHDKNDNQQAQNQSENSTSKTSSSGNQTLRSTPKLATDEMMNSSIWKFHKKTPLNTNITNYSSHETLFSKKIKHSKFSTLLKMPLLVDIPHKLDFNLIIAHLANITGVSITHHKDITPKQKPTSKKSPQQVNHKHPMRHHSNNYYPDRKTKPTPPITISLNQNGKRPIVPTNSNNHPDVNANAKTLK
ncbi:hypothetical protein RclHR1_21460005 [Rhizophagus clarus]|uniref:Uncharacterized protein n=1 Tax=Rhizophagus clarus TaxID=94130 RepID=A0A2Z6R626_9GLOM|nr:hypothetical protein RclHR1_21460005 [Rhizophagus clarus]